jgi:copper chaperone CopZ
MKRTIVCAALAVLLATPAFAARSIKAEVNGLVCSFCAAAIEKKLKAMKATKAVYVDLSKKVVAIELRDGQDVALEKITEEIKEAGYDVVKIGRSDQSIEQIRAEKGK